MRTTAYGRTDCARARTDPRTGAHDSLTVRTTRGLRGRPRTAGGSGVPPAPPPAIDPGRGVVDDPRSTTALGASPYDCLYSAATPATCGAAIDVPDHDSVPPFTVVDDDRHAGGVDVHAAARCSRSARAGRRGSSWPPPVTPGTDRGSARAVVGSGVARRGRDEHPAVHQLLHRRGQRVRPPEAPRHHRHGRPLRVARHPVDPREQRRERRPRRCSRAPSPTRTCACGATPWQPRGGDPGDDGAVAVAVAGRAVDGVDRRLRAAAELRMCGVDRRCRARRPSRPRRSPSCRAGRRAAGRAGRSGRGPSSPRAAAAASRTAHRAGFEGAPARSGSTPSTPGCARTTPSWPAVSGRREPGERAAVHRGRCDAPGLRDGRGVGRRGVRTTHVRRLRDRAAGPRQCRDHLQRHHARQHAQESPRHAERRYGRVDARRKGHDRWSGDATARGDAPLTGGSLRGRPPRGPAACRDPPVGGATSHDRLS